MSQTTSSDRLITPEQEALALFLGTFNRRGRYDGTCQGAVGDKLQNCTLVDSCMRHHPGQAERRSSPYGTCLAWYNQLQATSGYVFYGTMDTADIVLAFV